MKTRVCKRSNMFFAVVVWCLLLYLLCRTVNRRLNQFRYLGNDAHDEPCQMSPGSDKLGGHAVQNWCFLRLLPVLIGDQIRSPADNNVWQLVLRLRQMVEFICALAISSGQIAYLKVMIEDYLYFWEKLFVTILWGQSTDMLIIIRC